MKSQIETTEIIQNFAKDIQGEGIELAKAILKKIHQNLKKIEMPEEEEHKIRWKRTATQILQDGWVVQGKACTDLAVLFIALAKAKKLESKFVKLYSIKRKMLHSAVELTSQKIILDVTNGKFDDSTKEIFFDEYKVYKKGRDSWDIGVTGIESVPEVMRIIGKETQL
ncbi:MAG: hypothetical protein V1914_01795 [archaeon]